MHSLFRIIKTAFQDIARNFGLSFMTILILVLMLLSLNILFVLNVITSEAVSNVKERIDVTVYFNNEAEEEEVNEIRDFLDSMPEVLQVVFLSKEQVLEDFKTIHANDGDVISALEELDTNPLGASLIIKTREPKDYEQIIKALNVPEYENVIESKTFGDTEKAIKKIHIITTQAETLGYALSIIFALIAFLIIFNAIRITIYTQRTEIGIKKLVGATNWFIRGPYIVESIFFSFISVLIAYSIVMFIISALDPYIGVVFEKEWLLTSHYNANIIWILSIQFGSVLILTTITSLVAMGRYLRV